MKTTVSAWRSCALSLVTGLVSSGLVFGVAVDSTTATAALIGYYPLNGNLNDASGNGNNGTPGSNLTFGASGSGHTGSVGDQGIVSSGSDFNQYFTSPVNINLLPQVTFGGWFKTTATNPIRGLVTNDGGGFGRGIDIDTQGRGIPSDGYAAFNGGGPFGGGTITGGFDFVAVTYDRTGNTQTLDVNGTFYTSTGGHPPDGDPFLTIGKNFHYDAPFGGTIDDVFIYNQALSQTQLNNIQTNGVPEPASCVLLGMGAVGLWAAARRRRKA